MTSTEAPGSVDRPTATAVLLAGGTGTRVGADRPKQLLALGGEPVLAHALRTLERHPRITGVWLMMAPDHVAAAEELVATLGCRGVRGVLPGGATRADTVRLALDAVELDAPDHVLLHDAARPLVTDRLVTACLDLLRSHAAVTAAVPVSDTLVEVAATPAGEVVRRTMDRSRFRRVQTPQAFRLDVLRAAHRAAAADPDFHPTDDCGVVQRYLPDVSVGLVEGDERNLKVTGPLDLVVAEGLLRAGGETAPQA